MAAICDSRRIGESEGGTDNSGLSFAFPEIHQQASNN
jgi:hypothetical protein